MRTIKFRAWDKDEKVMVYDINLLCSSKHQSSWISDNGGGFFTNPVSETFEVMQFTGLLDKNGKEIYEGDVIKQTHTSNGLPKRIVKWDNNLTICGFNLKGRSPLKHIEVVGNIYENPELLGKPV